MALAKAFEHILSPTEVVDDCDLHETDLNYTIEDMTAIASAAYHHASGYDIGSIGALELERASLLDHDTIMSKCAYLLCSLFLCGMEWVGGIGIGTVILVPNERIQGMSNIVRGA